MVARDVILCALKIKSPRHCFWFQKQCRGDFYQVLFLKEQRFQLCAGGVVKPYGVENKAYKKDITEPIKPEKQGNNRRQTSVNQIECRKIGDINLISHAQQNDAYGSEQTARQCMAQRDLFAG